MSFGIFQSYDKNNMNSLKVSFQFKLLRSILRMSVTLSSVLKVVLKSSPFVQCAHPLTG